MWTLSYSGTEQPLGTWGLCADFSIELVNKGRDTVRMRSTELFDAGPPQFAWGAPVTIYRDRVTATPPATGFTGGSIFFAGYVADIKRLNQAGRQNLQYSFAGPWWLLERLTFKQTRTAFAGWKSPGQPSSGFNTTQLITPEVYLGESPTEQWMTNGAEIVEILNWANQCYNPTRRGATSGIDASQDILKIGTIDPAVWMPRTRASAIFCSEALNNVLRWSPDVVCWFDYTTTPPTFNARALANLATVSQTITAQQEREISLAPQYDRQLGGVIIVYKQVQTIDGVACLNWYFDKADAHGSGLYLSDQVTLSPGSGPGGVQITDYTPFVSEHQIELAGTSVTYANVSVIANPVASLLAGNVAAWQATDQSLADPLINPASIAVTNLAITDGNGDPVDTAAYPNILVEGQLCSYMGVQWIDCTLTATVASSRFTDNTFTTLTSISTRQVTHRIRLTNATTQTYRYVTQYVPGENVPTGLAASLYNSLKTLQYAGSATFVGTGVLSGLSVGNLLTLVGPTNTYATLLVQSVKIVPHLGALTATFSPSAALDAPELIELARAARFRILYAIPSGRATGSAPGSNDVGLGSATAKENTQHGVPGYSALAVNAPAAGSNGPVNVTLKAADVTAAIPGGDNVNIGVLHYVDAATGAAKYALLPLGTPQADGAPSSSIGPNTNIFLGAGSSSAGPLTAMLLQSVQGDYVTAWPAIPLAVSTLTSSGTTAACTCAAPHGIAIGKTANVNIAGATPAGYNGTVLATATTSTAFTYALSGALASPATGTITYQADVYVAKNWKLRCSRAAEIGADGTVYSLLYSGQAGGPPAGPNANNVLRTKTGTSGPGNGVIETEQVSPDWLVGDIFYAQPAITGVNDINGNPIALIMAGDTRNWTAVAAG
jgi:hypothetical protein